MSEHKFVLITGGARRIGRSLALAVARAGFDVAVHFGHARGEAESVQAEIQALGRTAVLLQADLGDPQQVSTLIPHILEHGRLVGLVNSAAIFSALDWETTRLDDW